MNRFSSLCLAAALTFSATLTWAQAPAAKDPFIKGPAVAEGAKKAGSWRNCQLVFEVYALERNAAVELIQTERGSGARYRQVQELAKGGQARLDSLTALTTKSGQRAVVEGFDEIRYPSEFYGPTPGSAYASPSKWEKHKLGDFFEVEPILSDDRRTCDLNLAPRQTKLAGFRDMGNASQYVPVPLPAFEVQQLSTSVALTVGEPYFLGSFTPAKAESAPGKEAPAEVWLAFMHVRLQSPAPAAAAGPAGTANMICLEYTCCSLERALGQELAFAAQDQAWEKLQGWLREKKARVESFTTLKTRSGQRAQVYEAREILHATDFTAPELSPEVRKAAATAAEPKAASGLPSGIPAGLEPGFGNLFETRNTGVTIEVEPVLGDGGQTVDLNQVVQSVALLGQLKAPGYPAQYPAMPVFEARNITTSLMVSTGQPALVGTLNPPCANGVNERTDSGRTWVIFVRATPDLP